MFLIFPQKFKLKRTFTMPNGALLQKRSEKTGQSVFKRNRLQCQPMKSKNDGLMWHHNKQDDVKTQIVWAVTHSTKKP